MGRVEHTRVPGKREKVKGIELVFRLKNQMSKKKKKKVENNVRKCREILRNEKVLREFSH